MTGYYRGDFLDRTILRCFPVIKGMSKINPATIVDGKSAEREKLVGGGMVNNKTSIGLIFSAISKFCMCAYHNRGVLKPSCVVSFGF